MDAAELDYRFSNYLASRDTVRAALRVGSGPMGESDEMSDLDFFVYVTDIGAWNRENMVAAFETHCGPVDICYWTGLQKFHAILSGVGVDLSVYPSAYINEIRRWPTLFFTHDSIVVDRDGEVSAALKDRTGASAADMLNTWDALFFHSSNILIQLLRGEYINARSRASGLLEAYICVCERRTVGTPRFREPSRRSERRMSPELRKRVEEVAFAGSPQILADTIRRIIVPELSEVLRGGLVSSDRDLEGRRSILNHFILNLEKVQKELDR
ncbi:hypothetical protein [Williamsia herbipolensis]|uniref:hypothetical protein n=1 Tax=Williamsia herbipolensis TaxID=1603258 RepID=UPI000AFCE0E5|nr:hypothetical protein [Williamsia herbipolensis]